MRNIVKNILKSEEYDVHLFASAEEAKLSMDRFFFEGKTIDLILLDVFLDEKKQSGSEFLEYLVNKKNTNRNIANVRSIIC